MLAVQPVLAISISESHDLVRHGLGEIHVRHAFTELTRHVLAARGSIAYGGDLRPSGYTEALFDLLRAYERPDRPSPDRVRNFLAWPIWSELTSARRAELRAIATLVESPAPSGAPPSLPRPAERSPQERLWFARALTIMREQMTSQIDAQLILGGRVSGQQGLCPGVLEEAALTIRAGVPLFPIGGFGGCGKLIVAALAGEQPDELTTTYQRANTPGYEQLRAAAEEHGIHTNPESLVSNLSSSGLDGLNNGLDREDNLRLTTTDDIDEIVALVLRGLRRLPDRIKPTPA